MCRYKHMYKCSLGLEIPFFFPSCSVCRLYIYIYTHILGENEVGLEVAVSVLGLGDAVGEGPVGLVPVDGHVAGRVVDQIVDVIAQLPRSTSTTWVTA